MRYSDDLLEEIRSRIPVSVVVGRRVKLKKAGREFQGLSPFKSERTPSFFVNDQKAMWFDHSSGDNGNAFTFLMKTEGISFPEAVERLAHEAGVSLPAQDPEATKREARRLSLIDVVELAGQFYREQLAAASPAREYLAARGVTQSEVDAFGIGYAPADRFALKNWLAAKGVGTDDAVAAGLLIAGDDIPVAYDRFRNRVMFPIHDQKGRPISFGGRVLPGDDAPAKYLNGSDTAIFDKGRVLFNAHRAREPAWNESPLVIVEGYAGTLASVRAGFPATVATMGTALTDAHLVAAWRMSDAPIIAYDGDAAGQKATRRAIDTALPMLIAGRSLKLARLPQGLDPDDVVRQHGAEALKRAYDAAPRLVDALWAFEKAGRDMAAPDDRAGLEAALLDAVKPIPDERLRRQYEREYRNRIRAIPMRPTRPLRSNSNSAHSMSPGNITLAHGGRRNGVLSLKDAMTILAIIRAPGAALEAIDTLVADDRLSGEVRKALDVLAALPDADAAAVAEALEANAGASVAAAREICHRAGVHSLDPEAGDAAALEILTRH